MRPNSRVLNRGLLLLCGLLLAAAGTAAVLAGTPSSWAESWRAGSWSTPDLVGSGLSRARETVATLPSVGGVPGGVLVGLGLAALLASLLVWFVCTRHRGGTTTVLRLEADGGRTAVDRNVAEALLSGELEKRPDVLSARTRVYRVRGTETIDLAVTVRRGADLARVLAAAEEAVDAWDALAGVRVPVVVRLSDRSWSDGLRASDRVR
ncbi:hypothetical protein [Promicromonospora iranensis]|uniref:Alkaline shock response membrane anchor protein AmaP n=1 Tax=Promicromonospora iranensis TaxID=1105144 RepID=A0ABU2CUG3_9MICO|nr:hypothetical protein [Promicromonospora iranensis]MDR7384972.1 hypothetical protein [Promicromonospora iranensis]